MGLYHLPRKEKVHAGGKGRVFPAQRSWFNLRVRKIPWTCSISMYPSALPTQAPPPSPPPPKFSLLACINAQGIAFQSNPPRPPPPSKGHLPVVSHLSSEKRSPAECPHGVVRYQGAQWQTVYQARGWAANFRSERDRERLSVKTNVISAGK